MSYNSGDVDGKKFGRLVVIRETERRLLPNGYYARQALCQCECGGSKVVDMGKLKSGHTRSCGCLQKQVATKHGMARTKPYGIWKSMRDRCNNPKSTPYKNYGGRGIKICDKWERFDGFWEDMKESYILSIEKHGEENTTLDRVENNKGYSKKNCKWSTRKEQQRNTRRNRMVEIDGVTKPLSQWIEESDINKATIHSRIYKYNMTPEEALTKKKHH